MSDERTAFEELARVITPGATYTIAHYLYFPTREGARTIAAALQARGFRVEDRLGADGINWLVLARHEVVPSLELIAATRLLMERSVGPHRGEYDGWEADVTTERRLPS
jgi:Regulator of ribonuclease activity B